MCKGRHEKASAPEEVAQDRAAWRRAISGKQSARASMEIQTENINDDGDDPLLGFSLGKDHWSNRFASLVEAATPQLEVRSECHWVVLKIIHRTRSQQQQYSTTVYASAKLRTRQLDRYKERQLRMHTHCHTVNLLIDVDAMV